jgi:hypothetical protein
MQGMSAPHDLQPSDWHHAVSIRTDTLVNTKAQACNGIPIHYPLLELCNNNLQLFTVSIVIECISIGGSHDGILYTGLLGYWIFPIILYAKK